MSYQEEEWIKALLLLGDMQLWLQQMEKDLFLQVPAGEKRKLFRPGYHINAASFAHILERHYHKIGRHPGASKFTSDVPAILQHIKDAAQATPVPLAGSPHFLREYDAKTTIGFTAGGEMTTLLTVITDAGGGVRTAFPGKLSR